MQQFLPPEQLLPSGRKRLLPAPALKLPGRSFALGRDHSNSSRGKTTQHTLLVFAFSPWEPAHTLLVPCIFWLPPILLPKSSGIRKKTLKNPKQSPTEHKDR